MGEVEELDDGDGERLCLFLCARFFCFFFPFLCLEGRGLELLELLLDSNGICFLVLWKLN